MVVSGKGVRCMEDDVAVGPDGEVAVEKAAMLGRQTAWLTQGFVRVFLANRPTLTTFATKNTRAVTDDFILNSAVATIMWAVSALQSCRVQL